MEEQRKSENALVPALRFEGFSDPWEQRTFDEFVYASGSRNADNLDLESHSVSNTSGFVPQSEQFENGGTMAEADKTAYWIVEPGSFAYNPARINVGSIGYLATRENVIVSSLYEVFRSDETCDDRFLWHWLKSALFAKQIEALQEGGVRLYFFFDKLLKSEITMPSIREQSIIGSLFDWLDSLIALHQRKHEKLKTVKQSLLEKMFPKEGEDVPEIRFEGFTDPWEQRRLGEICDEVTRRNPLSEAPVMMITAESGFIEQSERYSTDNAGESLQKYIVLRRGELAYNHGASKLRPFGSCFNLLADEARIPFVYHCFSLRSDCPAFTSLELNGGQVEDQLRTLVSSGARMDGLLNISFEEYQTVRLLLPSLDEQRQIAGLFAKLDSLIALHQRELDILKNLKQALLEKMFV